MTFVIDQRARCIAHHFFVVDDQEVHALGGLGSREDEPERRAAGSGGVTN